MNLTKKEAAKEELPVTQKAKVAGTTSSSQNKEHLQLTGQAEEIRSIGPGTKFVAFKSLFAYLRPPLIMNIDIFLLCRKPCRQELSHA